MSELLPCPFCGSQPATDARANVWCNNDSCAIVGTIFSGGARHWNRRTPAQQPAAAPVSGDVALPSHPEPHTYKWTERELSAIRTYGQQCSDAALERAAVICEEIAQDHWDQYKGRGKYAPNNPRRADTHADGCSDGANQCAAAIRALKGGAA